MLPPVTLWTLARRNLGRNPLRTLLTLIGVAVAVIAFVALRGVLDAWAEAASYASKDRLSTRHKVSYGLPLPKRYVEDIRARVPGVQSVTYCDWFGGRWAKAPNEFFANLACADNAFDVYPEMTLSPGALAAWKRDKQGAILGDVLAQRLGVKVGDRMTLLGSFYPGDWELNVVGIYGAPAQSAINRSSLFFRWEYKNARVPERQRDMIGWVFTRVDDPARAPQVSRAIDALFDDRPIRTSTSSERASNSALLGGVTAVLSALNLVSLLVLTIMALILGNTFAMGVREREGEYAVMLALGFQPSALRRLILIEALILACAGGVLGLALSFPLIQLGLGRWLEENMGQFFPAFRLQPLTLLAACAATLALGGLAAWLPASRVGKRSFLAALRRVA